MKFVLASLIALSFIAPAYAGTITYKTIITGSKPHKVNTKNCWHHKGNWVGGESYTACEFESGEVITSRIRLHKPKAS
jgi:hypothetical protein